MKLHSMLLATGLAFSMAGWAQAETVDLNLQGEGVNVVLTLTYGPDSDATYPDQAFTVADISGTVTYQKDGVDIVDAMVGPLMTPEPAVPTPSAGVAAPHSFSRFAVAAGLPADSHGTLTYDNLYWPGEAPSVAVDNKNHGGVLDFYGLLFGIGDDRFVNLWSNGSADGQNVEYGIAIVTSEKALAHVGGLKLVPDSQ